MVVTAILARAGRGTKVDVTQDLQLAGAAAQYGRGMIGDISQRMTNEFATCLEERISADNPGEKTPIQTSTSGAEPVKGIRLAVWAAWRAVVRFLKRLFGGRPA